MKYRPIVLLGLLLVFFDPALQSLQAASNDFYAKGTRGRLDHDKRGKFGRASRGRNAQSRTKDGTVLVAYKEPFGITQLRRRCCIARSSHDHLGWEMHGLWWIQTL